ncbi:MAG: NAD-dependent protein deacetylase [Woeseiaceae bacterium]|nr:NAD-dependent protein deacetylase [Woeseiaceae bacterium]
MHTNGEQLAEFLRRSGTVAVLTGAGVSSASGIPEYRDRDGNWKHAKPVQFADFRASAAVRRRYWARSFAGWNRILKAMPNDAHRALARLEQLGICAHLVTQNVDGLHQRAGHSRVTDLHGRLDAVSCLQCGQRVDRERWQSGLASANPDWDDRVAAIKPDGDVELVAGDEQRFVVPPCGECGGIMKPDVVFFGESVPRERVDTVTGAIRNAGALLIVGSSLMVFSGFRFARLALETGKPIAIVNEGRTRADDMATLKIEADCGATLQDALQCIGTGAVAAGQGR